MEDAKTEGIHKNLWPSTAKLIVFRAEGVTYDKHTA